MEITKRVIDAPYYDVSDIKRFVKADQIPEDLA